MSLRVICTDSLSGLSLRSKALSQQLRRNKELQTDPVDRNSGVMSTYSAELPPYAYAMPQQHDEHKRCCIAEVDSTALSELECASRHTISPEPREANALGGVPPPHANSYLQHICRR